MPAAAVTRALLDQARHVLSESFRPTGRPPVYGPPQPPLEELHGETFTPEMVGDMGPNPFGEDDYTVDQRVKAAQWLLDAYELNRQRPIYPRVWYQPGLYLLSGKMGDGKTLCATNIGVTYMMCGWPVYSTAAFLFGKRFDEAQTFAFPNFITPGCFLFADEFHAIYGRYQGSATRNQTLAQATASFRKQRILCFGTTAREWLVGGDMKASILGLGYPYRSRPKGPRTAPSWAYRAIRWYYPEPWGGKELRESFGEGNQHQVKRGTEYPHSYDLTRAGLHFNSWEKILLDFGGGLGADEFRGRMNGDDADPGQPVLNTEFIGLTILAWYEDGRFDHAWEAHNDAVDQGRATDRGPVLIPHTTLAEMFEREGYRVSTDMVKKGLSKVECPYSQRAVNIAALAQSWQRARVTRTVDMDLAYGDDTLVC